MIENWMPALAAHLETLPGLDGGVRYYADMPGMLAEFPIMLLTTRNAQGNWGASNGAIVVHQVQATIFVASQFLPEAHSQLVPFVGHMIRRLAGSVTLGGLVEHVGPSSTDVFYSGPGRITYSQADGTDREHAGIIFNLEVKEHDTTVPVTA